MNLQQKIEALEKVREYLETCETYEQVDRGMSMIIEIEQKYADYLTELIERETPDYIPMERQ